MPQVSLFITCLVDQLWPTVGVATVDVLRRAGCSVNFNPGQTCCGQPAFNTGYRNDARALAERWIELYEADPAEWIVSPSGSCVAMVRHFEELFPDDAGWRDRARRVAQRTHELAGFLVNVLGITDLGASFNGKVVWHNACHALRDLDQRTEGERLLRAVRGAELLSLDNPEGCCGFGGTFSVKYADISVAIADKKIDDIQSVEPDVLVSGDVSCLMHLSGRLARRGSPLRVAHLAEILAGRLDD